MTEPAYACKCNNKNNKKKHNLVENFIIDYIFLLYVDFLFIIGLIYY